MRQRRTAAPLVTLALVLALLVAIPAAPASATDPVVTEVVDRVNAERAAAGRAPVAQCARLLDAAQHHAQDQANRNTMTHVGSDGSTVGPRATARGYIWSTIGENVAVGYTSASSVMFGWMTSPGHRDNILDPAFTHVGVGVATGSDGRLYWSQVLGAGGDCGSLPTNPVGSMQLATSPAPGQVRVAGWAADPDAGTGPVEVHVYVGAAGTNLGPVTGHRPDLDHLGYGSAHGFDATVPAAPGSHEVCTVAINVGPGGNTVLGCQQVWIPDPASPFVDVLSTAPLFGSIVWLDSSGITSGFPDGTFRPGAPVGRGALAAFLHRAVGSPAWAPPTTSPFSDVPTTHPFYAEITWAAAMGITTGYADGSFRPGDVVTRGATSAFLHRLEGSPGAGPAAPTFIDVQAGHPFRAPVRWMAAVGITTGFADGTFRPGEPVSRQGMAAFLHRWSAI